LTGEDGLLAGLRSTALHVSLSTIAVATADRIIIQFFGRITAW
jgi:3-hydroxyisobutyrate dehydrogenase-like beta-hydroxyacid dehydrogenase